ncbi:MAG: TetR/AcrR family transcriptional regulator [Gammaproteobacteria bacterium]|jgi:TetR/AcrR family transcriptional repressor of mexJK operon
MTPQEAEVAGKRSAKHDAIVEAARQVFLETGYDAASMDAIATRAGVSKQTVYNHFGSKEDLFAAIIRSTCRNLLGPLCQDGAVNAPPETALRALATSFLKTMLVPDTLALYRVILSEAQRLPELAELYYRTGPNTVVGTVADYLERQSKAGVLKVEDPRITAEQFLSMLGGHLRLRALIGLERRVDEKTIEAYVDNAVTMLLRGCSPA